MEHRGLVVIYDGVEYAVTISEEELTIGRAPDNGLSLTEPSISWRHATVWRVGDQVWIRDLNSTNGTTLNGERIDRERVFAAGDTVLLGEQVTLRLSNLPSPPPPLARYVLEDLHRGRRFALQYGDTDLATLGIASGVVIHQDAGGSLWLRQGDTLTSVALGEPLSLGDARLQIVAAERHDTLNHQEERYPYRLTVRLGGPRGPEAVLMERINQHSHRITAENRVILLYLLARQIRADLDAGLPLEDVGWCDEHDLSTGIWGKADRSASTLPVLVHRLRKELTAAGLDHGFIERSRKSLRACLLDVVLE